MVNVCMYVYPALFILSVCMPSTGSTTLVIHITVCAYIQQGSWIFIYASTRVD